MELSALIYSRKLHDFLTCYCGDRFFCNGTCKIVGDGQVAGGGVHTFV